jgi:hypothetical protein
MTKSTISRRGLLLSTGAAVGAGAFYGPWRNNRVYAAASDKPLKIGITSDASGQYANSGASDRRGMAMAIAEFNDRGGVLGRQVETVHLDTETTPATGSRVAERLIAREECTFLIGAVSSGVANAISQVAQKYGTVYLNTNSSSPTESGANWGQIRLGRQRRQFRQGCGEERDRIDRKEMDAGHQRLCVGPQYRCRDTVIFHRPCCLSSRRALMSSARRLVATTRRRCVSK